jgi:hypothetical protein
MSTHPHLTRRALLAVSLSAVSVAPAIAAEVDPRSRLLDAVTPRSKISLIYVGAWDCVPCQRWKATELPRFMDTPLAKRVVYREVEAYRFRQLDHLPAWPEDLRWFQAKLDIRSGTPRFYALVENPDGNAEWFGGFGTGRWARDILPLAEEAVRKRDGA